MKPQEMILALSKGEFDAQLKAVYVTDSAVELQRARYIDLVNEFVRVFDDERDVSSPPLPAEPRFAATTPITTTARCLPLP